MSYWDRTKMPVILHCNDRRISAHLITDTIVNNAILKVHHFLDDNGYEVDKEGRIGYKVFGNDMFEVHGEALQMLANAVTEDERGIPLSLGGVDVKAFPAIRGKVGPRVPYHGAWQWLYYNG